MAAKQMYDLYWLGYLLTGDRARSEASVIETLDLKDAANTFFQGWLVTWSRKIFIAKVLGSVQPLVSAESLRDWLTLLKAERRCAARRGIDAAAGKPELERALLAMDWFPRCCLLLTVFEKLPGEEVAILLNASRECVKIATEIGLIELSRKLAGRSESTVPRTARAAAIDAIPAMTA
jgi:hypothetical protein